MKTKFIISLHICFLIIKNIRRIIIPGTQSCTLIIFLAVDVSNTTSVIFLNNVLFLKYGLIITFGLSVFY